MQKEGNAAVIEALSEAKVLLKEEQYAHKYPYDWRTKKPTIFRATSQWFASVEGFRCAERGPASAALQCCCKLRLQVLVAALFVFLLSYMKQHGKNGSSFRRIFPRTASTMTS